MFRQNHGVCCDEEEGVLRDGVSRSLEAFLRIIERVDVLGDDLHVMMIVLHLIL